MNKFATTINTNHPNNIVGIFIEIMSSGDKQNLVVELKNCGQFKALINHLIFQGQA